MTIKIENYELVIRTLVAVERSSDVNLFASHGSDSLSVEELLGNDGSKTTKQVASAVDGDSLL